VETGSFCQCEGSQLLELDLLRKLFNDSAPALKDECVLFLPVTYPRSDPIAKKSSGADGSSNFFESDFVSNVGSCSAFVSLFLTGHLASISGHIRHVMSRMLFTTAGSPSSADASKWTPIVAS
jgi:hypothetical protein